MSGTPPQTIRIGERLVGEGQPVLIIGEIGYNFNTLKEAQDTMDAAADCGVDAVKFQTFRAETVASRQTRFPAEAGGGDQFEEFRRYEMSESMHRQLFEYARRRGRLVFSTPSYFDDADLLERLDTPVYKIGSDDLTNLPFIAYVAKKGKPVILSTGMGTLAEVDQAVRTLRKAGNDQILLLHCVSNYPVRDPGTLNLRVIQTYREAFQVPTGFSDHTTTPTAAWGAVALGACIVERHFTIDKGLPAPDASFSADPAEMKALVEGIRELERALGDGVKRPAASEVEMRRQTRKSVVARTAIRAGETISDEKIIVKRPGTGIPPDQAHRAMGRRARRAITADEVITWDMLE